VNVLEHRQPVGDGDEVLGVVRLGQVVAPVVADPAQVAGELVHGDRPPLARELRDIVLHLAVEVERAPLHEQRDGIAGQRLLHAADPVHGRRRDGPPRIEIHVAEGFGPDEASIYRNGNLEPGTYGNTRSQTSRRASATTAA
jgi:hypothetical protein